MEKVAYDVQRATEETARCLLCFDAPCSAACPAGTEPIYEPYKKGSS